MNVSKKLKGFVKDPIVHEKKENYEQLSTKIEQEDGPREIIKKKKAQRKKGAGSTC